MRITTALPALLLAPVLLGVLANQPVDRNWGGVDTRPDAPRPVADAQQVMIASYGASCTEPDTFQGIAGSAVVWNRETGAVLRVGLDEAFSMAGTQPVDVLLACEATP